MKMKLLFFVFLFFFFHARAQTVAYDAGISSVTIPVGNTCATVITPAVVLKNFGDSTLTSCTINYQVDALGNQIYNWNGSLTMNQSVSIPLSTMTVTAGTHTFVSSTSSPNGFSDGNTSNDKFTSVFASNPIPNNNYAFIQTTFEGSANLPAGWSLSNPDNDAAWHVVTTVGHNSAHCLGFNNCDGDSSADMTNRKDRFYFEPINCTGSNYIDILTFDVAYVNRYYQSASYNDTLTIYYSTDCGINWTKLYQKGGLALASIPTDTAAQGSPCWQPTNSQWRNEYIGGLGVMYGQPNVVFCFENHSGMGGWVFIDNVMLLNWSGIESFDSNESFNMFPNPSTGIFNVQMNWNENTQMKIYNVLGECIHQQISSSSNFQIDISSQPNGIYFAELITDKGVARKKIVISK